MLDNKNRNGNNRPNQSRNQRSDMRNDRTGESNRQDSTWLTPTIKGIIAILITLLIVIIVIMIFAKSLFVNTNTTPKKTGTITSTEYIAPKTTTTSEEPKETKKPKKTTEEDEDPYDDDDNGDAVGDIQCISAVYLHPEPTSSSANLLTIPQGATCKFYRDENGWYYVDYNGTKGYAWHTFFGTVPTA